MNPSIVAKFASVQRCIVRVREEYRDGGSSFASDFSRIDAATLNVLRACQNTLDLAQRTVNEKRLGLPASNSDTFRLLLEARVIDREMASMLTKMNSYRNLLTHEYQGASLDVLIDVIENRLDDLLQFGRIIQRYWDTD